MPARTNEEIIRVVKKWQTAGHVHELTCRVESSHEPLIPIERDGKVVLGCPTCGTAQELIPGFVLESEAWLDMYAQRALATVSVPGLVRKRWPDGAIWTYGSGAIGASLLGLFWLGPIGAAVGCALGLIVAWFATRQR